MNFQIIEMKFFSSQVWTIFNFFYKDIQPTVQDKIKAPSIQVEFIKFDGCDRLRNVENILLVFDDS